MWPDWMQANFITNGAGNDPRSPMEQQHKLFNDSDEICSDPGEYQRLVGLLLYLTCTRPDINYVIHTLSQFMQEPHQPHLNAVHRVLRYLKGSLGQGILLPSDGTLSLQAYCNADGAECPITQRLTTGYVIFFGFFTYFLAVKEKNDCLSFTGRGRI